MVTLANGSTAHINHETETAKYVPEFFVLSNAKSAFFSVESMNQDQKCYACLRTVFNHIKNSLKVSQNNLQPHKT